MAVASNVVGRILRRNKQARDDDKILWLEFMNETQDLERKLGKRAYGKLVEEIAIAPAFDTTRRSRQKIQEQGRYLGKKRKAALKAKKTKAKGKRKK